MDNYLVNDYVDRQIAIFIACAVLYQLRMNSLLHYQEMGAESTMEAFSNAARVSVRNELRHNGLEGVEKRITWIRRVLTSCNGNDTFILSGRV